MHIELKEKHKQSIILEKCVIVWSTVNCRHQTHLEKKK